MGVTKIIPELARAAWKVMEGIPFIVASQKMKDSVSMIRTKQLVQRSIDSLFHRFFGAICMMY
jgi:hypothetical protein